MANIIDCTGTGSLTKNQTFDELKRIIGDEIASFSQIAKVFDGTNFNPNFVDWYNDKTGHKIDIDGDYAKELARSIIEYNRIHGVKPSNTTYEDLQSDEVSEFGYTTNEAREEGKSHMADFMLMQYNLAQETMEEIKGDPVACYVYRMKQDLLVNLLRRIVKRTGRNIQDVANEFKLAENKVDYLTKELGGQDITYTDRNTLAIFKELTSTPKVVKDYIDSLFNNPKLAPVYAQYKQNQDEKKEALSNDAQAVLEGELIPDGATTESNDTNSYIADVTNPEGKYSNHMKHITERLQCYFNAMPRLITVNGVTRQTAKDTMNLCGLPKTMTAQECVNMLYSGSANFHNVKTMIAYVRQVSTTVPGFECFSILADKLENDHDFATECFRVFAKSTMDRMQVVTESNDAFVRDSTSRTNKRTTFVFNLLNDSRGTTKEADEQFLIKELASVRDDIQELLDDLDVLTNKHQPQQRKDKINAEKEFRLNDIKSQVVKMLRRYYPTLEQGAILAYIDLNNSPGQDIKAKLNNIKNLLSDLDTTAKAIPNTKAAFRSREAQISKVISHNARLRAEIAEGKRHRSDEFLSALEIYKSDYLSSDQTTACQNIVDKLMPYSVVALQLTVADVNGNNSSTVINNSYITELKRIIDSTIIEPVYDKNGNHLRDRRRNPALEEWGKARLRDKRNKYSTILLEQTDENGEVINTGIFREEIDENGETILAITEDGLDLLDIKMFDGSSDLDNSSNMSYDKMTRGDFCPTAYIQFFKAIQLEERGSKNKKGTRPRIANYFPRIPSDSTTLYTIGGPRYDTSDLLIDEDANYRDRVVDEILNTIDYGGVEMWESIQTPEMIIANEDTIIDYVLGKRMYLNDRIAIGKDVNGDNVYVKLEDVTRTRDDGKTIVNFNIGNIVFTFEGTLEQQGNTNILKGARLASVMDGDYELNGDRLLSRKGPHSKQYELEYVMPDDIRKAIIAHFKHEIGEHNVRYNGVTYKRVQQKINRDSKVFNLFRTQFKQELMGCALAIDHYFDTNDSGWVIDGDEKNEADTKVIKIKKGRSNNKGYKFYHLGKNGEVLTKTKKGYELQGAAFHSNKFTLTVPIYRNSDGDRLTQKEYNALSAEEQKQYTGKLEKVNFLDDVITTDINPVEGTKQVSDGKIHLLYGGAGMNSFLHVTKKENPITHRMEITDVYLTDEQQDLVDDKIEEYLMNYLDKSETVVRANKDFIKGVKVDTNNIREFSINDLLFLMQHDDILDGHTGFYKNAQTVLKRAKEYQGSGMLYGMVEDTDEDVLAMSYLNTGTTSDDNGNSVSILDYLTSKGLDCKPRKTFTGVTVANTSLTNKDTLDPLKEELIKQGLSEEAATEIVYGKIEFDEKGKMKKDENNQPKRKGGFSDVCVNDAQSYITLDEWIRRIAGRGQLKRYLPLIKKLVDPNAVLTAEDLREFVQVQKNFYYDMHYDEDYGIYVPRQIKNAEFVLVPKLIKGTQLAKIYDLMKEAGINQLNTAETSKAANEDILKLWDSNGDLVGVDEFADKAKAASQTYEYRYLYTQQETHQHMNSTNKAGIQIVKKILDNIPKGHSLYNKKKEFMELMVQNIRESYDDLMTELNVERDKEGNIIYNSDGSIKGLNKEFLYDKLAREMRRLGLDDNLIAFVTLDENGRPLMPAYINSTLNKFESIFQSIFNTNITRQTLPGFHAAQVTNVGFRSWREILSPEEPFNIEAIDTSKVDIEVYDREKTPGWKNKALKIYIKGKTKGYFELVKDKEDEYYSVHFKTLNEKGEGSTEVDGISIFSSTKEEREVLYQELRKAIPAGAKVSTYGSLSDGGQFAIDKLCKDWAVVGSREVTKKKDGSKFTINVYEKPAYSYSKDLQYHPQLYKKGNKVIDQREYDKLSSEDRKGYTKAGRAGYVEVLLPLSTFGIDRNSEHYKNMSDEDILKELKEKGLDIIMGYRIPTEGKQSVANMKVVGFLDDAYGSTIVVPNEWVAQTGSDFDIDSVYGINYATYKSVDGEIHKIPYYDEDNLPTKYDYLNHIRRLAKRNKDSRSGLSYNIQDELNAAIAEISSPLEEDFARRNAIFQSFPPKVRVEIKKHDAKVNRDLGYIDDKRLRFIERLNGDAEFCDSKNIQRYATSDKARALIDEYKSISKRMAAWLSVNDANAIKGKISEAKQQLVDKKMADIEERAKKYGLPSFEEYQRQFRNNPVSANSREARNNRILDNMKDILGDDTSLEENLSRSNFDDIIYWRDILMNDDDKTEHDNRSPYDPFDQMRFQEDAISGTHLKGISVALDTWCSVCNTARPELARPIYVVYDVNDFKNPNDKKDTTRVQQAMDRFNAGKYDGKAKGFGVKHGTYGWSKDNRNIVGKLLTAYSSQTTAHTLDAVKEGNIPNVNTYTFTTYKTLLNVGSDYKTAIAFIMQPGVTRIVENYNANNSVFNVSYDNPIHQAIEDIARELFALTGDELKFGTPITSILSKLNTVFGNDFASIFQQSDAEPVKISFKDEDLLNLPLLVGKMTERLKGKGFKGTPENVKKKELLFDLGVILSFYNIHKIATEVGACANKCNPDKFGAKESIYATRKVFEDIHTLLWDYNPKKADKDNADELGRVIKDGILQCTVNGERKHILAAIYPGIDSPVNTMENPMLGVIQENDFSKSVYPTLFAYLKYASATSVMLSKEIFDTQHPNFVHAVKGFASVLSNPEYGMTESLYNDIQKYILTHFYNSVNFVKYPLVYKKTENGLRLDIDYDAIDPDNVYSEADVILDERTRIFGYNYDPSTKVRKTIVEESESGNKVTKTVVEEFNVVDINNPTVDEVNDFALLSPAQKVDWLKRNLDDPEIFDFYEVNLFRSSASGAKRGMQTLEFNNDLTNPNVVYSLFNQAYHNSNPLIQLAAMDLIKYAIVVEGLNIRGRAVTKSIGYKFLYTTPEPNEQAISGYVHGTGFIDSMARKLHGNNTQGSRQNDLTDDNILQTIYEDYLRAHPELQGIGKFRITKANTERYGIQLGAYGIIYLHVDDTNEEDSENPLDTWKGKLAKAHVFRKNQITGQFILNKYIRIRNNDDDYLYKIVSTAQDDAELILYPITPLENNEVGRWSAKQDNNLGYPSQEIYQRFIKAYVEQKASNQLDDVNGFFRNDFRKQMQEEGEWSKYWFNETKYYDVRAEAKPFNLEELAETVSNGLAEVRDKIIEHFSQPNPTTLLVNSLELAKYISTPGDRYGSVQDIHMTDDIIRRFNITKVTLSKSTKVLLEKDKETKQYLIDDATFETYIQQAPSNQMQDAMRAARTRGATDVSTLFEISPYTEALASMEDIDEEAYDFVKVDLSQGNERAMELVTNLQHQGVGSIKESVKNGSIEFKRELASFAVDKAQELKARFNNFHGYVLTDPELQTFLTQSANEAYVNDYVKLLNECRSFVDKFSHYIGFEIETDDKELKYYIDKIQEAARSIQQLDLNKANHNFAEGYVKSLSRDPRLVDNLIKVMDGYWKTYGAMWRFHDIMENGNPLLQITLKDVAGNLEAKRIATERTVRTFNNETARMLKEAAAEGLAINFDKFVDEYGRIKLDCSQEFIDEIDRMREAIGNAIKDHGAGSIEHIKAKWEFDVFKAKYINQEAAPEYYIRKVTLEKDMIDRFPELYSMYTTANLRRRELLRLKDKLGLTDEQSKELDKLESYIADLLNPVSYTDENGNVHFKEDPDPDENYPEELARQYRIYSPYAALEFTEFLKEMRTLEDEYYEKEPAFGFDELLDANLKTIAHYEKRKNGVPTVPTSELNKIEDYVEAKKWLRQNARFVTEAKFDQHGEPMNLGAKLQKALNYLGLTSSGKTKNVRKYIKELEEAKGITIIDEYGNIDATKLTAEEIKAIKLSLDKVDINVIPNPNAPLQAPTISGASDRILINSARRPDEENTVYNKAFYAKLSRRGWRRAYTPQELYGLEEHPDAKYRRIVQEINDILRPAYRDTDGVIHFEDRDVFPDNPEGIAKLGRVARLMFELKTIERDIELDSSQKTARQEFLDNEVVSEISESTKDVFRAQYAAMQNRSREWQLAWEYVNYEMKYEVDEHGEFVSAEYVLSEEGNKVPNKALYWISKPLNPEHYTDHKYNEAMELVQKYYIRRESVYYYEAEEEARRRNEEEPGYWDEWYALNHYYNPYTGKVEPLEIWTTTEVNHELIEEEEAERYAAIDAEHEEHGNKREREAKWVPKGRQLKRKVKNGWEDGVYYAEDDKTNHNYNKDNGLIDNYAGINLYTGEEDTFYKNNLGLNKYEIEMRDYIRKTLIDNVTLNRHKQHFAKGYLPTKAKQTDGLGKRIAKEAGKMFGIVTDKREVNRAFKSDIGYDSDRVPPLPMSKLLSSEKLGSVKFETPEPELEDFADKEDPIAEYNEAHEEWVKARDEARQRNRDVHKQMLDRNWLPVIAEFLTRAGEYNAIQEEKHKLYYVLNMLKNQKHYVRQHDGYGRLKQEDGAYVTTADEDLIKQYSSFIRRLVYDQWKEDGGSWVDFGTRLQSFTSADYMMLNLKGGISNVTVGETAILAEAAAGEYLDLKEWAFGHREWHKGLVSYFRYMYSDKASCKQDAIIKHFKVVDYDEISGVSTELQMEMYSERLRNAMFSPQTIGEHYMQNSVLFAMLHSHKIISLNEYDNKGVGYTFMNEGEYIRYREAQTLNEILTDDQKEAFEKWKEENVTKNADTTSDYAWFRKDALNRFIYLKCTKEQRTEFNKQRKEKRKQFKEEFAAKENMYSQCKLGEDGYLAFREGSDLAKLNHKLVLNGKCMASELLCGQFSERVRKVNNKIHGVYNKRGRAYIEDKWYGGLIMQYHKHLPTGILKRYRNRGYYNETRGTVEKGMIASIVSFLSLNADKVKSDYGWTDENVDAIKSLQFMLAHAFDYLTQLRETMQFMPDYDKANMWRNIGDLLGVLAGVSTTIALLALGDDDDDDIIYNLALYEADRLASEAFLYNPIGLWTETKTLMSTPVAAQSIITDALNSIGNICGWLVGTAVDGDEYDGIYHSGQFAGRSKLSVYIERRIPIWNGIRGILDIPNNNHYFKRGKTALSFIPTKKIAEHLEGK